MKLKPEPTVDGEPELAEVDKPLPHGATEQRIATEPKLQMMSVHVCELVTNGHSERENAEAIVERSFAHCNMAEGELSMDLGLLEAKGVSNMDLYTDLCP